MYQIHNIFTYVYIYYIYIYAVCVCIIYVNIAGSNRFHFHILLFSPPSLEITLRGTSCLISSSACVSTIGRTWIRFLHLETWSLELQTIQIGRPVGHNWKSIERCLLSQEVGQNDVSEYVGNNLANRKVDSCSQEHPNVESFKLQMTKKALPSSKRAALEHPKTSSCLLPIATHVSVMMGHGSRIA